MRRLTSILLVVVTGIAIFNFLQVRQMREELEAIRAKVHVEQKQKKSSSKEQPQDGLAQVLDEVKAHSKKAKALIADGDYKKARQELDRSLRRLERASSLTSDLREDAENALARVWDKVRYQTKKTWKDVTEDRGKGTL